MKKYLQENKHLFILSAINFVIIYASTFVKGYEYFIDEFYYIACASNPAAGYVDHPPLAPLILTVFKFFFGESVYVIRILPALASSVTAFMLGIIAKEMGGNKKAQAIASFSIMLSPGFAAFAGFYSMNAFEPMLAAIAIYYLIKMFNENKPAYWLKIGIVFGLLLLNKHTSIVFIIVMVISLLFTKNRKYLFSKYFIYCVIISLLFLIPNIIWQIKYDFPSLEFYLTNLGIKNVRIPAADYLILITFVYNPLTMIILLSGAGYILFNKQKSSYKAFGILFLLIFILFFINRTGRIDRISFSLLSVIPAGAIFINQLVERIKQKWIYFAGGILMISSFILIVPLLMPFLSYENSAKLTNFYGLNTEVEAGKKPLIPQLLADRIGWKEKVDMVGQVYLSLPETERERTIIAADNYGNAGALELYGKKYGFKNVVSGHNNYYIWSKQRLEGDIILQLTNKKNYRGLKESYEIVDSTNFLFDNEYCSPHERNLTVFICRKPLHSKQELLEEGKNFY